MNRALRAHAPEPRLRLLDNPLLVAMSARRMRRTQLLPVLAVTVLVGVVALLYGVRFGGVAAGHEREIWAVVRVGLTGLAAFVLLILGAAQVQSVVGEDRTSGLLDFHRATPTSSLTDTVGYLVGCTMREYVIFAVLAVFALIAAAMGGYSSPQFLLGLLAIVMTGWTFHAGGMLLGFLTSPQKGRRSAGKLFFVLFVLYNLIRLVRIPALTHLTPLPVLGEMAGFDASMLEAPRGATLFGMLELSAPAFTIVLHAALLPFLLWAGSRRVARSDRLLLPRSGACLGIAVATLIALGTSPGQGALGMLAWYGFCLAMVVVAAVSLVPNQLQVVRAERRRAARGETFGWFGDEGTLGTLLPLMSGMFLLSLLAAAWHHGQADGGATVLLTTSTGLGALLMALAVIALVSGVRSVISLRYREGNTVAVLVIFLVLVLPFFVAGLMHTDQGTDWMQGFAALSPLYGVVTFGTELAEVVAGSSGTLTQAGADLQPKVDWAAWLSLATCAMLALAAVVKAMALRQQIAHEADRAQAVEPAARVEQAA